QSYVLLTQLRPQRAHLLGGLANGRRKRRRRTRLVARRKADRLALQTVAYLTGPLGECGQRDQLIDRLVARCIDVSRLLLQSAEITGGVVREVDELLVGSAARCRGKAARRGSGTRCCWRVISKRRRRRPDEHEGSGAGAHDRPPRALEKPLPHRG